MTNKRDYGKKDSEDDENCNEITHVSQADDLPGTGETILQILCERLLNPPLCALSIEWAGLKAVEVPGAQLFHPSMSYLRDMDRYPNSDAPGAGKKT